MPMLDAERYLVQAIESVRAQTFGDWELLIVDDGSSDASPEIAAPKLHKTPGVSASCLMTYRVGGGRRRRAIAGSQPRMGL
jgi:glycosyltransferase involved in cell wall biosynthesis